MKLHFFTISIILLSVGCASIQAEGATKTFPMVTCFKCLANDTSCRDTCMGKYCYKSELVSDALNRTIIKRGCINGSDALSRVGECTQRMSHLPSISEHLCICTTDKCNGSSWWSSVAAFFTAVFAYLWKD